MTFDEALQALDEFADEYRRNYPQDEGIIEAMQVVLDHEPDVLNGVYLVHREEEDEPLWAFAREEDADVVVMLLKRDGTAAWASFQPIAYSLSETDVREAIGGALSLYAPEAKLDTLIDAAVAYDESAANDQNAKVLDDFFGEVES